MAQRSTPTKTTAALEAETAARHAETLADLYRRYAGWLRALLRRRYGPETEHLVQETYIRLAPFHAAHEIRHPQALLARVADNLARNDRRAEGYRRRLATTLEQDAANIGDAHAPDQFEALLFKQVVLSLPTIFRDVIVLSRFTGLTNAEIAERLGVPLKTVEWRLARALVLCARRLAD